MTFYACLTCVSSNYKNIGKMYCKKCIDIHIMNENHISKEYDIYDAETKCDYCDMNLKSMQLEKIKFINNEVNNNYFSREN